MSFLLSIATAFALPLILGFIMMCFLWPAGIYNKPQFLIKFFLAIGLGIGITSCIFFFWLLLLPCFASNFAAFITLEVLVSVCLIVAFFIYRKKTGGERLSNDLNQPRHQKVSFVVAAVFYIVLISSLISFACLSLKNPCGGWDAWAIWNLKARFIARGAVYWNNIFSPILSLSHPDYPLLIPLSIARCWRYIGSENVIIPGIIAAIFTFSTAGLIFSSLSILRGRIQGILGAMILLSTHSFVIDGGISQYADVPISFFMLATFVILAFYDCMDKKSPKLLVLGGMAAGLAAWTKNEGLLFVLLIMTVRFLALIMLNGWRRCLKESIFFLIGLLPVLLAVVYLKIVLAPPTDLFSYSKAAAAIQSSQSMMEKLTDYHRYLLIINTMKDMVLHFGPFVIPIIPFMIFYLLLAGVKRAKQIFLSALTSSAVLILMMVGHFFIYLISPYKPEWLLGTSFNRLILQLWPGFIFVIFLAARTSEES